MGSLITCNGVATRVKAVERWRIKDEQFLEMAALETVPDAVQYLCAFLPYHEMFGQVKDRDLHRENVEQHLNLSQYRGFAKLCQFVNIKQRRLLDLYFMHYKVTILKTCLRNVAGHREQRWNLPMFRDFFERHSALDLITLSQSQSMEEFIGNLKGSVYYSPLYQMQQGGGATLPACETALDMLHFRSMWRIKDKYLSKNEQKIIAQYFDTKMGMLNLQWICRSGKFYQLEPREIYVMLILIQLHLTREEISRVVEAENLDILYRLIGASWYGRTGLVHLDQDQDLDRLARDIIDRIYLKTSRKDPCSIAVLNSYLCFKKREIQRIIATIEKIRYGLGINWLKGAKT